jgi:Bardet-Biedl syndrome 2 protein
MIPAFTLKLGQQIQQNVVAIAKFDGKHPSLSCGTSGGRVFVHSPHGRAEEGAVGDEKGDDPTMRFLNFNRKLTAMSAGPLHPGLTTAVEGAAENEGGGAPRDLLLVGMQMTLLAYDVEMNSDIFYKDVQDGVNSMIFGRVPGVEVRWSRRRHVGARQDNSASQTHDRRRRCRVEHAVEPTAARRTPGSRLPREEHSTTVA